MEMKVATDRVKEVYESLTDDQKDEFERRAEFTADLYDQKVMNTVVAVIELAMKAVEKRENITELTARRNGNATSLLYCLSEEEMLGLLNQLKSSHHP